MIATPNPLNASPGKLNGTAHMIALIESGSGAGKGTAFAKYDHAFFA